MVCTKQDPYVTGALQLMAGSDPQQHGDIDLHLYQEQIEEFLPDVIIDAHVHLWTPNCLAERITPERYSTTMLEMIDGFSAAAMSRVYEELLPGKQVSGVAFGLAAFEADVERVNTYVLSQHQGIAARLLIPPWRRTTDTVEREPPNIHLDRLVGDGRFAGLKPYPEHARHRPLDEVEIGDFITEAQWQVAEERHLTIMLHLPRPHGIGDASNIATLASQLDRCPNARVVLAHVGVPMNFDDLRLALTHLRRYPNLYFDTAMVDDEELIARVIDAVGPSRLLFGTDLPFALVRGRKDRREGGSTLLTQEPYRFGKPAGSRCTYLLYESILAIKRASARVGLSTTDVRSIFVDNARSIFSVNSTSNDYPVRRR